MGQTPPCGQNSWHTLLKILPCPNFVPAVNIHVEERHLTSDALAAIVCEKIGWCFLETHFIEQFYEDSILFILTDRKWSLVQGNVFICICYLSTGGSASRGSVFGGGLQPGGSASGDLPLAGGEVLHPGGSASRESASSRVCFTGVQNIQQNVLHPGGSASRVAQTLTRLVATHQTLWDMVNEQVARILLACILVNINNKKTFQSNDNLLAVDSTKWISLNMLRGWGGPCMVRGQNQGSWAWDVGSHMTCNTTLLTSSIYQY